MILYWILYYCVCSSRTGELAKIRAFAGWATVSPELSVADPRSPPSQTRGVDTAPPRKAHKPARSVRAKAPPAVRFESGHGPFVRILARPSGTSGDGRWDTDIR